jgi:cytochrome c2/predicted  nucleic acid-binding Zn-ribbon protein
MPATEKTWRDQLKMHVIFGVTALVMLVATVWMLAKDHMREWRGYELHDRTKQQWTASAQLAQASAESQAKRDRLQDEFKTAERAKIDTGLVEQFKARVAAEDKRLADAGGKPSTTDTSKIDSLTGAIAAAPEGSDEIASLRTKLMTELDSTVREAKRREDAVTTRRKFRAANQTATTSERGIAVGEQKPREEIEKIEAKIAGFAREIADLDVEIAASKDYRMALEAIVRQIEAGKADLQKQIAAIDTDLNRLRDNVAANTSNWQEWINRWPILDALYNGNIKLTQIWLPDISINYNFRTVPRYDRCTNCHRAIDATAAGSATEPAFPNIPRDQRVRTVQLSTPESAPPTAAGDSNQPPATLMSVYGIGIAPHGQIDPNAQTIQVVLPGSRAAEAGLMTGDIIEKIGGSRIHTAADVTSALLVDVAWGRPAELTIRRGLDQPFTTHPRLDLFLGSTSPHKMGDFGCTICHDGQGSATDFKWASHTPDNPNQALDWSRKYGWFDNHHWIFPMTPEKFVESNCLKCHHEVVELEPSERFPEPPAPKLVEGYKLVQQFGCYGCHEITGFDGPNKRIGPDLRIEPNYYDVAAQVLRDSGLSEDEKEWAGTLVHSPDADDIRHNLLRSIKQDASLASATGAEGADGKNPKPRLSSETHTLADSLKDVDTPGRYRKVGPSLRHLDSKVDFAWLYSWIRKPADFRPSTRMPQFFGHFQHLEAKVPEFTVTDAQGNEHQITDKEYTARFEGVEVRALSEFLLANSQPFEYLDPPQGVTEGPSVERGKWLFESRGCLACHSHVDFPNIHSVQGPDLSRVAAKFNSGKGQRWLYSWLKAPNRYHARTAMPNLFLDPIAETDPNGTPTGRVTDPAADIASFLLSVPPDWQPEAPVPSRERMTTEEERALEDLTAVWLSASFPKKKAAEYARTGIPEQFAATVKVDEKTLVGMTAANRTQRQLTYVARRSLSRYGCFGCHDIPGYEGAKPIGTPLANWGRKDVSQLAFENITTFLATHGVKDPATTAAPSLAELPAHGDHAEAGGQAEEAPEALDPLDYDNSTGYFLTSLNSHQRHGFLWQKLRMPRSFDFATTKTKRYDERLRMPKFPFTEEQREAVMTFILGLVSEPPAEKYIYHPGPRQEAIVQGRHVLDKYNCAGCHILDMERWKIAFDPKQFEAPPTTSDFPFLAPNFTQEEIKASLVPDRRGMLRADLHGMTTRSETTGEPNRVDQDGVALAPDDQESQPFYEFGLYQPALVGGYARQVGVQNLMIPAKADAYGPAQGTAFPGKGGDLAKYLFPHAIAEEKKTNPSAKGSEAWGWLPPPLTMEGGKVQTDWLHDFLMDPTSIRPAVVMRMPNFHMSSTEASKLVNYFAAKGNAEFPYEYNGRRRSDYVGQIEQAHPKYFDDAMKIVTDGNYCVKCHSVGDYHPKGAVKTLGPNLADVYRRLRPDYVRRWIGNPVRTLPYTGMPVNIPYDASAPHLGGVNQALFPGTSVEQLDALVDLLMNFDNYAKRHTSVKALVKEPTGTPAPGKSADASRPRSDQAGGE